MDKVSGCYTIGWTREPWIKIEESWDQDKAAQMQEREKENPIFLFWLQGSVFVEGVNF